MLMSLQTAALFGSQSLTMTQLQTHFNGASPPGTIYEPNAECAQYSQLALCVAMSNCAWNPSVFTSADSPGQCQLKMTLNDSARSTFDAVAAFSAINLLLQGGMLFLLRAGGGEFGGGHGSSYNDIAPPVSQGSFSQGGVSTGFESSGANSANEAVASQYRDL